MADILARQSRNHIGVTNNVNNGSKPLSIQLSHISEWVSINDTRALEQAELNGMKPSLMLEITAVLVWLWQVNMSAVKRVYNGLLIGSIIVF